MVPWGRWDWPLWILLPLFLLLQVSVNRSVFPYRLWVVLRNKTAILVIVFLSNKHLIDGHWVNEWLHEWIPSVWSSQGQTLHVLKLSFVDLWEWELSTGIKHVQKPRRASSFSLLLEKEGVSKMRIRKESSLFPFTFRKETVYVKKKIVLAG